MTGHVFISHSDKDAALAELILNALEERGVRCWISPRDIPPGGSYADAILTAIEDSGCFVLIYTENSNTSGHVLREVERALKFDKNIVPLRFDRSAPSKSLDYLLATVHWLSIPSEPIDSDIARVADLIAACVTANSQRSGGTRATPNFARMSTPAKTARTHFWMWLSVIGIICAILILVGTSRSRKMEPIPAPTASGTPRQTPLASPSLEESSPSKLAKQPPAEPVDSLRRYFECFGQRDSAAAYDLLSTRFKAQFSFRKFSEMFASTREIQLTKAEKTTYRGNSASLIVSFKEIDAEGQQAQWQGPIVFVRESQGWRIDTLRELRRISNPAPPGKTQADPKPK